jgi:hypothetical protein
MRRSLLGLSLVLLACRRDRESPRIHADPTPGASSSSSAKPAGPPSVIDEKVELHDGIDVTLKWPRIDLGTGSAGKTISTTIEKDLRLQSDQIHKNLADAIAADADAGSPFLEHWELDVECSPTIVSHHLVSIACEGYEFEGGAHGMPIAYGFTFDVVDDEPVEVQLQTIVGAGGIAHLAPPCLASLKKQGSTYANDGTLDATSMIKGGVLSTFVLEKRGLTLVFLPYVAGPYAEGEYTVTLDWATVRAASTDPQEVDHLQAAAEEPGAISQRFGEERDNEDAAP